MSKTFRQYRDILRRAYDYYTTLSLSDIELIHEYSRFGYFSNIVNSYLNGLEVDLMYLLNYNKKYPRSEGSLDNSEMIKAKILQLCRIILNAPRSKESITVYRGTDRELTTQINKHTGEIYQTNQYIMSTSIVDRGAEHFITFWGRSLNSCCLYRITVPKGTPLLPIIVPEAYYDQSKTVFDHSDFESARIWGHYELLFPPYCRFQKQSITTQKIKLSSNTVLSNLEDGGIFTNRIFESKDPDVQRMAMTIYPDSESYPHDIVVYNIRMNEYPTMEQVEKEVESISTVSVRISFGDMDRFAQYIQTYRGLDTKEQIEVSKNKNQNVKIEEMKE